MINEWQAQYWQLQKNLKKHFYYVAQPLFSLTLYDADFIQAPLCLLRAVEI